MKDNKTNKHSNMKGYDFSKFKTTTIKNQKTVRSLSHKTCNFTNLSLNRKMLNEYRKIQFKALGFLKKQNNSPVLNCTKRFDNTKFYHAEDLFRTQTPEIRPIFSSSAKRIKKQSPIRSAEKILRRMDISCDTGFSSKPGTREKLVIPRAYQSSHRFRLWQYTEF